MATATRMATKAQTETAQRKRKRPNKPSPATSFSLDFGGIYQQPRFRPGLLLFGGVFWRERRREEQQGVCCSCSTKKCEETAPKCGLNSLKSAQFCVSHTYLTQNLGYIYVTSGNPGVGTLRPAILHHPLIRKRNQVLRQNNHLPDHAQVIVQRAYVIVCSRRREGDAEARRREKRKLRHRQTTGIALKGCEDKP
jgi:hypothetical protein